MAIQRVAVIGAGAMGNGIAHVFARRGFSVLLNDVDDAVREVHWIADHGLTGGALLPGVPPGSEQVPSSCSWMRTRPVTGHSSQPYTWVTGRPAGTAASCQT